MPSWLCVLLVILVTVACLLIAVMAYCCCRMAAIADKSIHCSKEADYQDSTKTE